MSERVWRNTQDCARLQRLVARLAGDSRLASRQSWHTYGACRGAKESCQLFALQDKSPRLAMLLACSLNSRLSLVTRSSRQTTLFGKNWLFTFLSHPTIYRPLYPRNVKSFQRDFWERNPREKQDWFIHNLHIKTLQIPLLSSSPFERHITKTFSHHTHICEKTIWCLGSS